MGYPVEKIDKETQLFVYIGPNAIEEERDRYFNRHFKEADLNKTLMPLNIREEDLGFFIHNFKNSKIKGGYFAQPYQEILHGLLNDMSDEAKRCGLVDTIMIQNGAYIADVTQGYAVLDLIEERISIEKKRIAVIGATPLSKSLLWHLREKNPMLVVLMDEVVEAAAELDRIAAGHIETDIRRIQNREIDLSDIDIVIDTLCSYRPRFSKHPDLIVTLKDQPGSLYSDNGLESVTYDEIFAKIAQIKTKEWIDHE